MTFTRRSDDVIRRGPPRELRSVLRGFVDDAMREYVGGRHASEESVLAARRVVLAANLAARKTASSLVRRSHALPRDLLERDLPPIDECTKRFVPTAICLRRNRPYERLIVEADKDQLIHSRFLSAVYLQERIYIDSSAQVHVQTARAYLAPPATAEQSAERAELLLSLGKGVQFPPDAADGGGSQALTGRMNARERQFATRLPLDEQIALVAVLAGREGLIAAVSPGGNWPTSPLVTRIARRLACQIERFSLRGVSPNLIERIREVRYAHTEPPRRRRL